MFNKLRYNFIHVTGSFIRTSIVKDHSLEANLHHVVIRTR